MSWEQFHQTVAMQEEYEMKRWLEEYIDNTADVLVCRHCYQIKGLAHSCCDDKDWMFFSQLPLMDQMNAAKREWDRAFGENK